MKKVDLISVSFNTGTYQQFVARIIEAAKKKMSQYVCVANVHMLIEAYTDPGFADVVQGADIITPDGKAITWGMRLLHGIKQDRVAGMDLLPDLIRHAALYQVPVYFYGGSPELLQAAENHLKQKHPSLRIAGMYSPPFRRLAEAEEELIVQNINQSGAELVFVILGCPKQEKWMAAMKGKINALMIGVGGALHVMVGQQKRAPLWMQHTGFEWLYRLIQEPRRLFKRYAVTNSMFIYLLFKAYWRRNQKVSNFLSNSL